jgi:hypothetical protein
MTKLKSTDLCHKCGEAAHRYFCTKPDWVIPELWRKMNEAERQEAEHKDMVTTYQLVKQAGITFEQTVQDRFGESQIVWMHFTVGDWTHRLGLHACSDGLQVYDGETDKSLGYFDMYYRHTPYDTMLSLGKYTQYVIDAVERDDAIGYVKYLPCSTTINFEHGVHVVAEDSIFGEFWGCDSEKMALCKEIEEAIERRKRDAVNERRKRT